MKKIIITILTYMLLAVSTCFSGELGPGDIDWEKRMSVDPRTGDITINTGPRDASELNRSKPRKPVSAPEQSHIKESNEGREFINIDTGERVMGLGGGESINMDTGETYIDIGGGDQYNVDTGEQILDIGDGEKINVGTGHRILEVD